MHKETRYHISVHAGTTAKGEIDNGDPNIIQNYRTIDFAQMQKAGVVSFTDMSVNEYYWLASTYIDNNLNRCVNSAHNYGFRSSVLVYSGGTVASQTNGIRPIITLYDGIQTTGKDANGVWQLVAK